MGITIFKQSAALAGLVDQGEVARPLSEPACRTSALEVALTGAGGNRTGVWECTVGRYERQVASAELMHILAGRCTFTPDGGEPLAIEAGDTLFFPANTTGVWFIQETMRKVYAVLSDA